MNSPDERKILNKAEALERFDGEIGLWTELARMFVDEPQFSNEQLQALLAEGKNTEAERLVHKLKGAAGTIGCEQLYDAAMALDSLLKGKTTGSIPEAAEILYPLYSETCRALSDTLQNQSV